MNSRCARGALAVLLEFANLQLGFLDISGGGGDVVGMHHLGVGAMAVKGIFAQSFLRLASARTTSSSVIPTAATSWTAIFVLIRTPFPGSTCCSPSPTDGEQDRRRAHGRLRFRPSFRQRTNYFGLNSTSATDAR